MSRDKLEAPLLTAKDWCNLRRWYRQTGRHWLPWRHRPTPWSIFIAETLLHRTRAEIVGKVFHEFLEEFPSPFEVVAKHNQWIQLTSPLGLNLRSRIFLDACEALISRYNGVVPEKREELLTLPGVGEYVADAVLCFGMGKPATLVDTNTIRLTSRISGMPLSTAHHRSPKVQEAVCRLGENGMPPGREDNYALLDLAAGVCLPRKPKCSDCPLRANCYVGRKSLEQT